MEGLCSGQCIYFQFPQRCQSCGPHQAKRELAYEDNRRSTRLPEITNLSTTAVIKKVPTRTGPRCAPSACNPCRFAPDQRLHFSKSKVPNPKI